MKKVIFFALSSVLFFSACRKQEMLLPESNIVYTDDPPQALFAVGTTYGYSDQVWVDSFRLKNAMNQGYKCLCDQNGMAYECGDWYLIQTHKFYGIMGEKIYVSKSLERCAITPSAYMRAIDVIRRKGSAIGFTCNSCPTAVPASNLITWIQ